MYGSFLNLKFWNLKLFWHHQQCHKWKIPHLTSHDELQSKFRPTKNMAKNYIPATSIWCTSYLNEFHLWSRHCWPAMVWVCMKTPIYWKSGLRWDGGRVDRSPERCPWKQSTSLLWDTTSPFMRVDGSPLWLPVLSCDLFCMDSHHDTIYHVLLGSPPEVTLMEPHTLGLHLPMWYTNLFSF